MLSTLCQGLAALLVLGTLLSVWRHPAWWVRMWDFPRVQLLVLGLLILASFPFTEAAKNPYGKLLALLLALSLVLQGWRILPYTPLAKVQSVRADPTATYDSLSILVSNVLMENRQSQKLIDRVRAKQPDIFFAVETDARWARELSVLESTYPYSLQRPLDNTYGLVLYSRLELIEPVIRYLFEDEVPSCHSRVRLASGTVIRLHLLHPKPPYPAESLSTIERDAEILVVGREVGDHEHPTIVAGDLNDVAWSHTTRLFQRISGLLDPRIGRGLFSTFHAQMPFMRWPLDHVFHSQDFKLLEIERLASIGSDHFPIFVRLGLDPRAPEEQEAPRPENGDEEEVEKKIENAVRESADPEESLEVIESPLTFRRIAAY